MKRVLSKSVAASAVMITGMTTITMIGVAASTVSTTARSAKASASAATAQANPSALEPHLRCLPGHCPQ